MGDLLRGHDLVAFGQLVDGHDVIGALRRGQRTVDLVPVVDQSVVVAVVPAGVNHAESGGDQHLLGKSLRLHAGPDEPIRKCL